MENRYWFFKRIFPFYVIVFSDGKKKYSWGNDKLLMKFIDSNDISYVIVDNNSEVIVVDRSVNRYVEYLEKMVLLLSLLSKKH